jgi:ribosome-binding factor A
MRRRFQRKPPTELAAELATGDGADPRFDAREASEMPLNRKALQLAAQVEQTLVQVFAGECGDEVLFDLRVEAVRPAPDSAHLMVVLSPGEAGTSIQEILEHLERASGRLRSVVAAAIHRKKAPELSFRVVRRT